MCIIHSSNKRVGIFTMHCLKNHLPNTLQDNNKLYNTLNYLYNNIFSYKRLFNLVVALQASMDNQTSNMELFAKMV